MFYAMLHVDNFILIVLSLKKKKKNYSYSKFAFKLFRLNIVMFLKKLYIAPIN